MVGRHSFFPVKAATAHGIDCVFLLRAASPPLRQKLCPCRGRAFAAKRTLSSSTVDMLLVLENERESREEERS